MPPGAPGRPERSPAQAPLRTVRESFPSYVSGLSKIHLCRGDPAIRFVFFGILSRHLILPGSKCTGFSDGISSPDETSPLLKILDAVRKRGHKGVSPRYCNIHLLDFKELATVWRLLILGARTKTGERLAQLSNSQNLFSCSSRIAISRRFASRASLDYETNSCDTGSSLKTFRLAIQPTLLEKLQSS